MQLSFKHVISISSSLDASAMHSRQSLILGFEDVFLCKDYSGASIVDSLISRNLSLNIERLNTEHNSLLNILSEEIFKFPGNYIYLICEKPSVQAFNIESIAVRPDNCQELQNIPAAIFPGYDVSHLKKYLISQSIPVRRNYSSACYDIDDLYYNLMFKMSLRDENKKLVMITTPILIQHAVNQKYGAPVSCPEEEGHFYPSVSVATVAHLLQSLFSYHHP